MFQENAENKENPNKLFQYCSRFLEREVASSSWENTRAGNIAISDANSIASDLTKMYTSEFHKELEDWLDEEYCPDCGQQLLIIKSHEHEGNLCQSPTPNSNLGTNGRESTAPHQPAFDHSTSDYETSSEFGSSHNSKDFVRDFAGTSSDLESSFGSLPPVKLSFIDDM